MAHLQLQITKTEKGSSVPLYKFRLPVAAHRVIRELLRVVNTLATLVALSVLKVSYPSSKRQLDWKHYAINIKGKYLNRHRFADDLAILAETYNIRLNPYMYVKKLKWKWAGQVARLQDQRWTRRVKSGKGQLGTRGKVNPTIRWYNGVKSIAGYNWLEVVPHRYGYIVEAFAYENGVFVQEDT
ncbi:hypothetical protein EVAR_6605_1 [Eumeta japonica]|uniref:Uncharacterized protein n=1 Tax=Eumeta variegata TaxID=151549 RepID=A0A4C1TKC6_EUMVA|nr:hypothetical protein EVAR_6605_1 [Eumeta japonica]